MKCPECGYRIRGKNHKKGSHHKSKTEDQKEEKKGR